MTAKPVSVPAIGPELGRKLHLTAGRFVDLLTAEQRSRAVLAFQSRERRDWHYVPRERPGLALREMNETQRGAALDLLRVGLSEAGGRKALQIMERETILKRIDPGERYDPLDYAFVIYGAPRQAPPWAWSVEGHHLSLNFTVVSETEVTVTPSFMGVAPVKAAEGGAPLHPVLGNEQTLAFEIIRGCDASERDQAIIAGRSMGDILAGPGREESLRVPAGLALGRLAEGRRGLVLRLIEEYLGRLHPDFVEAERARMGRAGVENLHFAWSGALEPTRPHYYRIHGPTLLLEYDNTQEDANHIHTVWHDPGLAFGGDALRAHYLEGHALK